MDVVRITQALRQQQQNPGRLNTTRTGGSSLVAASAGFSTGETLHINTAHASMDNGAQTTPCSSPTPCSAGGNGGSGGVGGPISPSSSFFSSLAHFLPGSVGVAAAATVAGAAGSSNVGEIESLLLRSMPMFGNLVSRD